MLMDARIPVSFGTLSDAGPDAAVLFEGSPMPDGVLGVSFLPGPGVLAVGCACCSPRGPLARAIGEMFTARAKGEIAFFRRVIGVPATEEGRAAMVAVLSEDPLCSAWFRLV